MLKYEDIFSNNKTWVDKKKNDNPNVFYELSKTQNPDFLLITCCDSRVSPLQMIGAEPGEVFIHRNVANIVDHSDPNCMSALEYAIHFLNVKHIVICGHYFCGGVMAAGEETKLDVIDPWIKPIRQTINEEQASLLQIKDPKERHESLVRKHVIKQCNQILSSPSYRKAIKNNQAPEVHGWVLDIEYGRIVDLGFSPQPNL